MSGRITVHGPYKHRNRWRLHVKEGSRTIISPSYPTRKEANKAKQGYLELAHADFLWSEVARLEEELAEARAKAEAATQEPRTVGELIEDYVAYLRDHKQRAASTVQTTRFQLNGLLAPVAHMAARALTAQRAEALYRRRAAECAAATHHAGLKQARTLWRWAAKKKLVRPDVWKEIEPIGTPNEGKEQLHPTAAKLIFHRALAQAIAGKPEDFHKRNQHYGAAAVLILLVFGMRPGEIVQLTPTELDRGLLYIRKGKTRKSRRWLRVPAAIWRALEPLVMQARAEGRKRLFPFQTNWVGRHTKRLCREENLPEVCAHALRGTHATLATEAGATAEMVADQLGHEGTGITHRHYIDPAAAIEAAAAHVFADLSAGLDDDERDDDNANGAQGDADDSGQLISGKQLPTNFDPADGDPAHRHFSNDSGHLGHCKPGDEPHPDLPH